MTLYGRLPRGWHLARFKEFLGRVDRKIILDDSTSYSCVGVRWYGMGAFIREQRLGMDISRKQQWIIKAGDVVYNKLFAWKGAFAIADDSIDNCIVSDKFPTYEANLAVIDTRFLGYYFCTSQLAQQAQDLSKGAAAISKLTLNPPQFWDLTIPLPPLSEQRLIVKRIEELTNRIEEAKKLRKQAIKEAGTVVDSALKRIIEEGTGKGWNIVPLNTACEINPSKRGISYPFDLQVSFVPMEAVDAQLGKITHPFIKSYQEVSKGYTWFIEGDVIFARITPCMENGKAVVAKELKNGVGFGSTEFHVLRPREGVLSEWIHYFVRQSNFRKLASANFKGTAGQQRVPKNFFYNQKIPVPSIEEQHYIIAHLDRFQSQINNLKRLQSETQLELDALIPSVLATTFGGGL